MSEIYMMHGWDELGISSTTTETELRNIGCGGKSIGLILGHDSDDGIDRLLQFLG